MKILHYITDEYPLGTPGRFTDLLEALEDDGHSNTILMQDVPILRAALERKNISYILNNVTFLNNVFKIRFYKKNLRKISPDIIFRYINAHDENLEIIEDFYDGPIRNMNDIYIPTVNPDASTKKLDREETITPEENTVIGIFCPAEATLKNINIAFEALSEHENVTIWLALNPSLSQTVQTMAAQHNLQEKIRLFDVTVPRGAFYKGCDIIFVPSGGIDSDISYIEAMSLGIPAISCNPNHKEFAVGCDLEIHKSVSSKELGQKITTLAGDEAMRIRLGEQQRQIYETRLTPEQSLLKILDHV